ncbi:MAG: DUF971 domain-containing protein [Acidimicrobiales bacterium]
MAVDPRSDVSAITVERTSHVEVTFADGVACRFELADLRMACPCATCRTARDLGRPAWRGTDRATPLAVADAQLVGAWGLGITWNDGHSTGIYPFESLRRWCDAGRPDAGFPDDSGLVG